MSKSIRILAIESSCDETAAAVLEDGVSLKSSVVASQMATHVPYGGVVPELASREHLRNIVPVVRRAVEEAKIQYADIDAIAVTQGPGLVGALMVGLVYAKSLAMALGKPLIAVNHLEGHIFAVLLEERLQGRAVPELPALSLLVSGGHTLLAVSKAPEAAAASDRHASPDSRGLNGRDIEHHVMEHRILARTRDDSAGEAFDKVAKLLGLGYPGGPVIDKLAKLGDPRAVPFTRAKMKGNALDFSFSGIKTAVLRYVESNGMAGRIAERNAFRKANPKATFQELAELCEPQTRDLVASFQHSVVAELVRHTLDAAANEPVNSVFVSGGVAANSLLRERFMSLGTGAPPVFFPRMGLSTDNAAMIAAAAYPKFLAGKFADWDLSVDPSLKLEP